MGCEGLEPPTGDYVIMESEWEKEIRELLDSLALDLPVTLFE